MEAHPARPPPTPRSPRRTDAAVVVGFAALALGLCGSILANPARYAIGHPANDVWNHIWGYWWVAQSLVSGRLPLHTDLLGWPDGGSLWFIDAFDAVLLLPVTVTLGPVVAYNMGIWLNLTLCGVGAWALTRSVTGSAWGAVAAGVAYMTTPHLLGQAYNGISETLAAGWLPLAVLAMREALRAPSPGRGALAGLAFAVNALANWYYGLFAGMILGGMLVQGAVRAIAGRRRTAPMKARATRLVQAGAVGALIAGSVAIGPFALFAASMSATDALVTRDPSFVLMTLVMHNMTDVLALVHPGRYYSPDLHAAFGEDLIVVVYLGAALWIPALFVIPSRVRAQAEPWLLLTAGFTLLSLGPFLFVDGTYVDLDGAWLPLPFLMLFQWIPMFSRISHAYRFAVGAALGLSVLVGFAVRAAERRGVPALAAALGIAVARVGESLFLTPAVWPLPVADVDISPLYATLTGGAIVELPITQPVLARSKVLVNQLVHGQPLPFGLNDPVPTYLHRNHYTRYLVELERRDIAFLPPDVPWLDLAAGAADLRLRGARWIVVHRDGYDDDQYGRVTRFLDLTATPYAEADGLRVYELRAP